MKKMKKTLVVLLSVFTGLSIVACGKNKNSETISQQGSTAISENKSEEKQSVVDSQEQQSVKDSEQQSQETSISQSEQESEQESSELVEVYDISLQIDEYSLVVGEEITLRPTITLNDEEISLTDGIEWSTNKDGIIEITDGKIVALASGTCIVTVTAKGVSATCTITVEDEIELAFENPIVIVANGNSAKTSLELFRNGVKGSIDDVQLSFEDPNFAVSVEEGKVVVTANELADSAILKAQCGDVIETVRVDAYKPIYSVKDFQDINDGLDKRYLLMQDLDFQYYDLQTICHYDNSNGASLGFSGIFDGNGHSLNNVDLTNKHGYSGSTAIFGVVLQDGIIRNVEVNNVHGNGLDYSAGLVGINFGNISNCKITVGDITGLTTENYTFGSITAHNKSAGKIDHCVVDISNATLPTAFGGISSRLYTGNPEISNCVIITGEKQLTEGKEYVFYYQAGEIKHCQHFASYSEFLASNPEGWDDIWDISETGATLKDDGKKADILTGGFTENSYTCYLAEQFNLAGALSVKVNGQDGQYNVSYSGNFDEYFDIIDGEIVGKKVTATPQTVYALFTTANGGYYIASTSVSISDGITVSTNVENNEVYFEFAKGEQLPSYTVAPTATQIGNDSFNPQFHLVADNENVSIDGLTISPVAEGQSVVGVYIGETLYGQFNVRIDEWHLISTVEQFMAMDEDDASRTKKYKLANDIDFTGVTDYSPIAAWYSNCPASSMFSGKFDGQGYAIKNLTITNNAKANGNSQLGVFGQLNGATVKNVNLINVNVIGDRFSGILAHYSEGVTTIENVYIRGSINVTGDNNAVILPQTRNNTNERTTLRNVVADIQATGVSGNNLLAFIAYRTHRADAYDCYVINEALSRVSTNQSLNGATFTNCHAVASYVDLGNALDDPKYDFVDRMYALSNEVITTNVGREEVLPLALLSAENVQFVSQNSLTTYADGKITAVAAGNDVIELKLDVNEKRYTVTFNVTISPETYELEVNQADYNAILSGGEYEGKNLSKSINIVKAKRNDADAFDLISYTSSNESVATVENGVVSVIGNGKTTITMTLGQETYSFAVTSYSPIYDVASFLSMSYEVSGNSVSDYTLTFTNANLAKNYVLLNDIDFAGLTNYSPIAPWFSGTTNADKFSGIFDGQGYSLKNLSISHNDKANGNGQLGVFGQLRNATIKNFNIIDVNVSASTFSGMLAHYSEGVTTIENIYIRGSMTVTGGNNAAILAQTISSGDERTTFRNIVAEVTNATGVNGNNFLAFVAYRRHRADLYDCYVINEALAGVSSNQNLADTTFTNCHAVASYAALGNALDDPKYDFVDRMHALSNELITTNVGKTIDLPLAVLSAEAVQFVSQNSLTTYADGKLTAVAAGDDVIELKLDVNEKRYTVTFNVKINAESYELEVSQQDYNAILSGGEFTGYKLNEPISIVKAKKNGEDATNLISYTSSNENVATVVDGKVVVAGNGSAIITMTLGSESYNFTVTSFSPVYDVVSWFSMGYTVVDNGENSYTLTYTDANLEKNYMLINDIDFATFCSNNYYTPVFAFNGSNWSAAGAYGGIFDGNGYSLRNISNVKNTARASSQEQGIALFGLLKGTIRNFNVTDMQYDGSNYTSTLVHGLWGGRIENVFVDVTINTSTILSNGYWNAGVVSQTGCAGGYIKNVFVNMNDTVDHKYFFAIAGNINGGNDKTSEQAHVHFENVHVYGSGLGDLVFNSRRETVCIVNNSCSISTTVAAMYDNINNAAYDSNVWNLDANKEQDPKVKTLLTF